ncbi:class I SAM-dependent methyltransferase [Arenimonas caeni]|uniref:Methyltransferase type 11 domain-containing protein n=1 Tax=Arenimonas caeni TaxID=2058085 RepID=A0A2P6MBX1_9GAMM|nr:hypothetical protein C6N40_02280 [Arenimonas caeni]
MSHLRAILGIARRTPLHPQWLLGPRKAPGAVRVAQGVVLDIGAGDRWIERLVPPEAKYVALDYPRTALSLYGARPHILADAASLPVRSNSVDLVVCLEVIEHVRDPESLLREVSRVLRPNGRACLSMPFIYPVHDAPHDYQRWTRHGWERSIKLHGLESVQVEETGSAVESAGLMACLALAGPLGAIGAWRALLVAPVALPLILLINVGSWLISKLWFPWRGLSSGIQVELRKPNG